MAESASKRPGSLAEVGRRVRAGTQAFGFALAEFLDDFYLDDDSTSRRARIEERPADLSRSELDALLGAIGEHLHRRWHLPGEPPPWTDEPHRFLRVPWFPDGADELKAWLLAESPLAFRRRMIFTEAEPLRRARMPQDARWWAFETQRTGLTPDRR